MNPNCKSHISVQKEFLRSQWRQYMTFPGFETISLKINFNAKKKFKIFS